MKLGLKGMPRRTSASEDARVRALQMRAEVVRAERHALWQRVLVYPAAQRREVLRKSVSGVRDVTIAAELLMPLDDVRAIMQAFNQLAS